MVEQIDLFEEKKVDFKTVPIYRRNNPISSKVSGERHKKKTQQSKCMAMFSIVRTCPGKTFTEYWNDYRAFLTSKKFLNEVDCSRQLYVLQKKMLIKRNTPGRECRITGNLCCTWETI